MFLIIFKNTVVFPRKPFVFNETSFGCDNRNRPTFSRISHDTFENYRHKNRFWTKLNNFYFTSFFFLSISNGISFDVLFSSFFFVLFFYNECLTIFEGYVLQPDDDVLDGRFCTMTRTAS